MKRVLLALAIFSSSALAADAPWIGKLDSTHYVVDRARVKAFLERGEGVSPDPAGGLVVRDAGTEWARAGLHNGDRIVELNGLPVGSLEEVRAVLRRLDGARAFILGVTRYRRVELYEYRFGDPVRDVPFSDPEIHSLADVVRKYWVTRVDDAHYDVDLAAITLIGVCVGPKLSNPDTAALKSKLPFTLDADSCAALGIQSGDKLKTLNGKAIVSADDFMKAIDADRDPMVVELDRAGARVRLSYAVRPASRAHPGEPLAHHPEILLFGSRPSAPAASPDPAAIASGIRRVDAEHVELDRSLRDEIFANPSSLATAVRVVPSMRDGRANGFKLYAIRPSSVVGAIGFQNGDTLQAVNGELIDTPDLALAVWSRLHKAKRVTIDGERRGKRFSINIDVVEHKNEHK